MPPGIYKRNETSGMGGKKHSEETKRRISENGRDDKNIRWKGGSSNYYHRKARELFGTFLCETCGISIEEYRLTHKHRKFQMHCNSRDYTMLEVWNWKCVCSHCHHELDSGIKKGFKYNA